MSRSSLKPLPSTDDTAAMAARLASGHLRSVARCISLIENDDPLAGDIITAIYQNAGRAMVVGVTGVPGSGKSTLVPELAKQFAAQGRKPAILAVDPSSPITGGAILGDRIRDTSADAGVFFRSVASRGSLGGLSRTLDDVVTLLDASGFDVILIETVGTGQSEIAVTKLAHTTLAVTAPGLGDEVQAMKAGILEVADIVVVNKKDADPRGAEVTADTLRITLSMSPRVKGMVEGGNAATGTRAAAWLAPIRSVSALKGDGLGDLIKVIAAHREFLVLTSALEQWRSHRRVNRFHDALREALYARLAEEGAALLKGADSEVSAGRKSPLLAAREIARAVIAAQPPSGRK